MRRRDFLGGALGGLVAAVLGRKAVAEEPGFYEVQPGETLLHHIAPEEGWTMINVADEVERQEIHEWPEDPPNPWLPAALQKYRW